MRVEALWTYPVKSMAAQARDQVQVLPWGFAGDRRYAVVDPTGEKVTAREVPALLGLRARADGDGLVLTDLDGADLHVATPREATPEKVQIKAQPSVHACAEEAHRWLSERLGRSVRLVWQPDPTARPVRPQHGGHDGESVTLADAGPVLLTTRASLEQLDRWAFEVAAEHGEQHVGFDMRRFRPNLVLDGDEPFAEDTWSGIRVGGVDYRTAMVCDRCVMTTIDPDRLSRGKEPLRTLARHRRWDAKTWFGTCLVPQTPGEIRVGDPVSAVR